MALTMGLDVTKTIPGKRRSGGLRTMTDHRARRLRQQLLAHRQDVQRQIDHALAEHRAAQAQLREESSADTDDMSLRDSQNHQTYSVLEVWHNTRNMLDAALRRLDDGTYGLCEDCLMSISEQRLKALPFVRRCIECQRHVELMEQIAKKEDRSDDM